MKTPRLFRDRVDAGRRLAACFRSYRDGAPLVLGLTRGGVPVAVEIAHALDASLDVWVVRKIGAPFQPELGLGAVAEGGEVFLDNDMLERLGISEAELADVVAEKSAEVAEHARSLRRGRPAPAISGKVVIVVDDGIATGGTARAALRAIRRQAPAELILAVPIGAAETIASLRGEADHIMCLAPEPWLDSVGQWYENFGPISDTEITSLLDHFLSPAAAERRASERRAVQCRAGDHEASEHRVHGGVAEAHGEGAAHGELPCEMQSLIIEIGAVALDGDLVVPVGAQGIVVFAHGSGSSRKSPRNIFVAQVLERAGLATLLFDLLTSEEEAVDAIDAHLRFDIDFLSTRLIGVTDWLGMRAETRTLRIGYFGASTGAAAALTAAAARPAVVGAVVSRGGRPDLAEHALTRVVAPTLLIVGGEDRQVLRLNRAALTSLAEPKKLVIVPFATHLFEEPGALEHVADQATEWFVRYLGGARVHEPMVPHELG